MATGNLSVLDGVNGADTLTISVNGANYHFSDPGGITAGSGASTIDANNVEVPIAAVTGTFVVQTNGGSDSITFSTALSTTVDLTVDTGTGTDSITIGGALTPGGHASLTSAGAIIFNDAVTMAVNKNLTVSALGTTNGTINLANTNADLSTSGTGAISLTTARDIVLASGSSVTTANGNITLSANAGGTTTGSFIGVDVNGGLVQVTGTGVVSLTGKGGSTGGNQYGVNVQGGGDIIGGTSGTMTVSGTGGPSGNSNIGVRLSGSGSTIGSSGADVQVTGQGGSGTGSSSSYGIHMDPSAQITAGGSGNVTVTGTGGSDPVAGDYLLGVVIANGSVIDSSGGNVSVTGTGGVGTTNEFAGIFLGSTITAGGAGTVTVIGNGGTVSGANNTTTVGVDLRFTALISSSGGNVSVTGTGGNGTDTEVGSSAGVRIFGDSTISASGTGTVSVTGIGTSGTGTGHEGVYVSGNNFNSNLARIGAANGATTVTATSGNGSSHALVVGMNNTGRITTGTDNAITINADSIDFGNSATISSGAGATTINTRTTGTFVDLGGTDVRSGSPLTLGLTDAELDKVTAGTLTVGSPNSGAMSFSVAITQSNHLTLVTGAGMSGSGALTLSAGRNLSLTSNGIINLANIVHQVTVPGTTIVNAGSNGVSLHGLFTGAVSVTSGLLQIFTFTSGTLTLGNCSVTGTNIQLPAGNLSVAGTLTSTSTTGIIAESMDISGSINAGSSTVALNPATATRNIDLGSTAGVTTTLNLSNAELNAITAATIEIGSTSAYNGTITVSSALAPTSSVSLKTALNGITFNDSVTMAANKSLTATALGASNGTINFANANADLAATGTGAISLTTVRNILMTTDGASVTTVNGDIAMNANQQATQTAGNFTGFLADVPSASGVLIHATGAGNITINGRGGIDPAGVFTGGMSFVNTAVSTNTGSITMVGVGGQTLTNQNNGLQVHTGGIVESTGGGSIDLTGTGGGRTSGAGQAMQGIRVLLGGTVRTTGAGNITLTGTGGAVGAAADNYGVRIDNVGSVTNSDSGTITINATGGANNAPAFRTDTGTNRLGFDGVNPYSGNIVINADSMDITGADIQTTGTATLRQQTNSTLIDLGGADSAGTLGLTDAELDIITAGTVQIGDSNSGAITVSAALTHANSLSLITGAGIAGSAPLTLAAGQDLSLASNGAINLSGAITVPGVTTLAAGAANDITLISAGNALATISTISGATVSLRDDGGFNLGATNVTTLLSVQSAGAITQSGTLSGTGGLTKLGSGTLTLSAANTYTGMTNVNAGTLIVNGSLADGVAATDVTVTSGATLGGTGTISGSVSNSGTVQPGGAGAAGTLTIGGDYTQDATGILAAELGGTIANSQYDVLSVTGTMTLAGTLDLAALGGFIPALGQTFAIIANDAGDAIIGTFNGLPEAATFPNLIGSDARGSVSYLGDTGNDFVITALLAPLETDVVLAGGNLTITDIMGGASDDTLTIQLNGTAIRISDPIRGITAGVGMTQVDSNTVDVPLGSVTGRITFDSLDGNDTLTVDWSGGNPIPAGGIFFNGDGPLVGPGDRLILTGGSGSTIIHTFTDLTNGNVIINGAMITYTGLEQPITDELAAVAREFIFEGGAETITLGVSAGATMLLGSTAAAGVVFASPSGSLGIDAGTDIDTIMVDSLAAPTPALISIDGGAGADSVALAAGLPTLTGLTVVTETIAALPALNIGAAGLDITAAAGDIAINGGLSAVGAGIVLRSSGAITTNDSTITAQDLTAEAVTGIALTLDGVNLQAVNTGAGGITLDATVNPTLITTLSADTGTINLNSGMFLLNGPEAIVGTSDFIIGGTLDLGGFTDAIGGLTGAGTITNSALTLATLSVGTNGNGGTFSGSLSGQLVLVKAGPGSVILSGSGSYSGGTIVNSGTLQFDAFGSALNGAFSLGGGMLRYNLPGPTDTLSPAINLTEPSFIDVSAGTQVTLTGVLSGPGGLTKTGEGLLVLGNEMNSFGGHLRQVKITGGTLQVATDGALGDPANTVVIDGATFAASAGFASGRNFVRANGVATIDAQVPGLTLINKAIIQSDLTPLIPENLTFAFVYAPNAPEVTAGTPQVVGGVTVAVSGDGTAIIHAVENGTGGLTIDTIEVSGTTTSSKLIIEGPDTPGGITTIDRIVISNPNDHLGAIVLGTGVILGNGVRDSVPDVQVAGKVGKLEFYDLNSYALIELGKDLPYDVAGDKKAPDTYNHHPDLDIHAAGPGIVIDVTGDGVAGGKGGGGLGKIVVDRWDSTGLPGAIRTTQSIGSFTLINGDCTVVFEVDALHHGTATIANVGSMKIQNGSWGSSGSEIEGDVKSFDADGFLAGATLTAGSMGAVKIGTGGFAGLLTLTDPDGAAVPVFTVNADFAGSVVSASPLKKLKIKGDFTGELQAPFIGSITAYAFLGTNAPGEYNQIIATAGSLGTLTATAGVVKNFAIITDQAFKGFNIKLSKLEKDTVGIDNVRVQALSIGNISVSLAAAKGASGIDLTGIRNSEFITTGTGATKTDMGGIGNITVKISGQDGVSLGLEGVAFSGDSIGTTSISVTPGKGGSATATAIDGAEFTARGAIGAIGISGSATSAMVTGLNVLAGTTVGAITIKSAVATHGSLTDSAILAGQSLDMTSAADPTTLKRATLGAVNVSGSIINTRLVAGGSIGAVTAGQDLTDSLVLAGAKLGGDFLLDGNETYQRTAAIASITVKGAFARTSIVAGIDPGNAVFGDGDDTAATNLPGASSIGKISLSAGTTGAATGIHQHAIEAAAIAGVKIAGADRTGFPFFVDAGTIGTEEASDILVRLI